MIVLAVAVLVILASRGPTPQEPKVSLYRDAGDRRRLARDHDRSAVAVSVRIVVRRGDVGARRVRHAGDRECDAGHRLGSLAFDTEHVPLEAVLQDAVPPADHDPLTVTPLTVA